MELPTVIIPMMVHTYKIHAFTTSPSGGNPAGVVLDAQGLTSDQMKHISSKLQVSETAFIFPSEKADLKTRFFSPTTEVDLCGHATIALFTLLGATRYHHQEGTYQVTQETNAGILPVKLIYHKGSCTTVMMTQQAPDHEQAFTDRFSLAHTLGIPEQNIDDSLPWERVSTGLFTLPVCVTSLKVLESIRPNPQKIRTLCQKLKVGSLHVYSFDTYEPASVYHARNFAPIYGILEDPVTGTANGAVCSYLHRYRQTPGTKLICEQGDIIGRPGRVHVDIQNDQVQVGGSAVIQQEKEVKI
jgi:PhzF family phenazine biosynthesis protein